MNDNAIEKRDQSALGRSESDWELLQRQAKAMASSSIVPQAYQGNIPNVIIAMEIANRIGASTMAVMQHLYIVHGKPSFEATFLIATVNASSRWTPIRFRMEGTQGEDDWGCRAYATDEESGAECVGPAVTIAMAKAEGWYDKKGSKWKTMPELMLHYRAAAFWTRVYAPELSMGIHTVDELRDASPTEIIADAQVEHRSQIDALTEKLKQEAEEIKKAEKHDPPSPAPEPDDELIPRQEIDALAKKYWPSDPDKILREYAVGQHGIDIDNMSDDEEKTLLNALLEMMTE